MPKKTHKIPSRAYLCNQTWMPGPRWFRPPGLWLACAIRKVWGFQWLLVKFAVSHKVGLTSRGGDCCDGEVSVISQQADRTQSIKWITSMSLWKVDRREEAGRESVETDWACVRACLHMHIQNVSTEYYQHFLLYKLIFDLWNSIVKNKLHFTQCPNCMRCNRTTKSVWFNFFLLDCPNWRSDRFVLNLCLAPCFF